MYQKFLRFVMAQFFLGYLLLTSYNLKAQTLAFPGADGFGKFTTGARGAASPSVYIVTNLNDSGAGSFRDAVSQQGRFIVFAVGGIVKLNSDIVVPANTTIAGQTAPGDGIVFFGKRITFSGANNSITRYLRIRLGATDNSGKDASGIANGANMIFDHLSVTWGMDEVFSINWDNKGNNPDNITIQNSILGQGLHRANHSAGGLIQPGQGGKVSLIRNLYTSNKTRNPKVKGINEFVNNVVYNWGNFGNPNGHTESGDAYIMGGDSAGESFVNIINNYFMSGPSTRDNLVTPFNRGNDNFNLFGSGNYFDNNKNGALDGTAVPYDLSGYPTGDLVTLKQVPFDYPLKNPVMTATEAFNWVIANVGASYPRRDQVDSKMISDLNTKGTTADYLYRETDNGFVNGGLGNVYSAPAPLDTDADGLPDAWEDANGLDKNNKADAVFANATSPDYLNIEVYINGLTSVTPPDFIIPPSELTLTATSIELPSPKSTVVLKWKDNSANEDKFILERSLNGTSFTEIAQPATDIITYTDTDLIPNTTYYYRIKAVNATESSSYSATFSVTTPPIPTAPAKALTPSPTTGYNFTEVTNGSLTLKWTGSSNTTNYEVYFGTTPGSLTKLSDVAYSATPSYQVSGLSAGTTYYWRIDASNNKGNATGDVWTFRTIATIATGVVGYWAFDETLADGLQVTDSTAYANHGILGLDDDDASIRVAGKVKNALNFATARTDIYVVSVPNQDQLYLDKSSFSISFWMKADPSLLPTGNTTSSYLLCKGSISKNATTGATGKRFNVEFKSGQFRFAIDDDVVKRELATSGTPFFTGNWEHVVIMRDVSSNQLKLYLNGALVTTFDASGVSGIGEVSSLVIGNIGELEFLASANTPAPYKGQLDELKIFNYALNQEQVMQQYHTSPLPLQANTPTPSNNGTGNDASRTDVSWGGGINTTTYKVYLGTTSGALTYLADKAVASPNYQFTGLTANTTYYWRVDAIGAAGTTTGVEWSFKTAVFAKGIVADWRLDASSGIIIIDNSVYANNGTIDNVTTYQWTTGKLNNGLSLQTMAANSAVNIPHQEQIKFDKGSFSVSMWVKASAPASSTTSSYLFHKGTFAKNVNTGATGKWYGVEFKNNKIYFAVDDDVNKSTAEAASTAILNNSWVHLVFVRNVSDRTLKIYKDGTQLVSVVENATSINNGIGNIEPLLIANNRDLNAPLTGALDEIKIYNYALSTSEISDLKTLPVSFKDFKVSAELNRVKLDWETLSENNNERFVIERSLDGKKFKFLTSVNGNGTTASESSYTAYDNEPLSGTNYYRLSQYDLDGKYEILGVKAVKFGLTEDELLIYPNPVVQQINIKVPANIKNAVVRVSNLNGTEVYSNNLTAQQNQLLIIELENKPAPGIYLLEIKSEGFNRSSKIIIK